MSNSENISSLSHGNEILSYNRGVILPLSPLAETGTPLVFLFVLPGHPPARGKGHPVFPSSHSSSTVTAAVFFFFSGIKGERSPSPPQHSFLDVQNYGVRLFPVTPRDRFSPLDCDIERNRRLPPSERNLIFFFLFFPFPPRCCCFLDLLIILWGMPFSLSPISHPLCICSGRYLFSYAFFWKGNPRPRSFFLFPFCD